ncbi:MAG: hypothetical protein KAR11_05185 [Phycisphaerae bacterium]|nr:hypothetical protein [Phycisphaerae bacterium]
MKKRTKWILGTGASIVVLFCVAGFIYYQFFFTLDIDLGDMHLFEEGPTEKVNLNGWEKLEKGMTKKEVSDLLGEPGSSFGIGGKTIDGNEPMSETWEYNWTVGLSLFGNAHPRAYVVRFGPDGKLALWREPIDKENKKGGGVGKAVRN